MEGISFNNQNEEKHKVTTTHYTRASQKLPFRASQTQSSWASQTKFFRASQTQSSWISQIPARTSPPGQARPKTPVRTRPSPPIQLYLTNSNAPKSTVKSSLMREDAASALIFKQVFISKCYTDIPHTTSINKS